MKQIGNHMLLFLTIPLFGLNKSIISNFHIWIYRNILYRPVKLLTNSSSIYTNHFMVEMQSTNTLWCSPANLHHIKYNNSEFHYVHLLKAHNYMSFIRGCYISITTNVEMKPIKRCMWYRDDNHIWSTAIFNVILRHLIITSVFVKDYVTTFILHCSSFINLWDTTQTYSTMLLSRV